MIYLYYNAWKYNVNHPEIDIMTHMFKIIQYTGSVGYLYYITSIVIYFPVVVFLIFISLKY